jgi:hypothetical protein
MLVVFRHESVGQRVNCLIFKRCMGNILRSLASMERELQLRCSVALRGPLVAGDFILAGKRG